MGRITIQHLPICHRTDIFEPIDLLVNNRQENRIPVIIPHIPIMAGNYIIAEKQLAGNFSQIFYRVNSNALPWSQRYGQSA